MISTPHPRPAITLKDVPRPPRPANKILTPIIDEETNLGKLIVARTVVDAYPGHTLCGCELVADIIGDGVVDVGADGTAAVFVGEGTDPAGLSAFEQRGGGVVVGICGDGGVCGGGEGEGGAAEEGEEDGKAEIHGFCR